MRYKILSHPKLELFPFWWAKLSCQDCCILCFATSVKNYCCLMPTKRWESEIWPELVPECSNRRSTNLAKLYQKLLRKAPGILRSFGQVTRNEQATTTLCDDSIPLSTSKKTNGHNSDVAVSENERSDKARNFNGSQLKRV